MQASELSVPGVVEFRPQVFPDARGLFVAPFQEPTFVDAVGHRLYLAQSNHSVSARGVVRGVHFAEVPPGQAKYVYCPRGSLLDLAIDLRIGSATFGQHDAIHLDDQSYRAVYLPEGIGHAFVALTEDTILGYLCSASYNPTAEHAVNPLDPALALPWPSELELILSDKDRAAPSLAEARSAGILPRWEDCQAHYARLRAAR